MKNRYVVKFAGQSGQGINLLGKFFSSSLKNLGHYIFAYREYPSIIRGGYASYQIDVSSENISASSKKCDILTCFAKEAFDEYIYFVNKNGVILHSIKDISLDKKEENFLKGNNIQLEYFDLETITKKNKAPLVMGNVVLLSAIFKLLNLDVKPLEEVIVGHFKNKKGIDLDAERRCIQAGYNFNFSDTTKVKKLSLGKEKNWHNSSILSGNDAIALGAITAGCRAYYAYPMTPATSILATLGNTYQETGIIVKQAESEITAALMVLGSMYMGTRAFTATSGGGFDLMTESISFAGIAEIPLVIVLGQRAGSGTGVPTWTGASDLDVALHAGHGEFPRCVMVASDAIDSYELIQDAFNIAEIYQIPVILLTEKQVAESLFNIRSLPRAKKIERGLITNGQRRYEITKNGISPRWLPKKGKTTYLTNSDEHDQYGISTESESEIVMMSEKRERKIKTLSRALPPPKYYGPKDPTIVFVGIGSTKNAVLDAMKITKRRVGYLHYKYVYPFKKEKILEFADKKVKIVLIENNQTNQLGKLIKEQGGIYIPNTLNKYDGRPFFVDDILNYLKK